MVFLDASVTNHPQDKGPGEESPPIRKLVQQTCSTSRWKRIRRDSVSSPLVATEELRDLLETLHPRVNVPILWATLLIWDYFFNNEVNSEAMEKCLAHTVKYEPWLAAAVILDLTGGRDEALAQLGRAREACPSDPRIGEWQGQLAATIGTIAEKKEKWLELLFEPGRVGVGSKLSWSLSGDVKSKG
jgi:hypothetical protein